MELHSGAKIVAPYLAVIGVVLFALGTAAFLSRRRIAAWVGALSPQDQAADGVARLSVLTAIAIVTFIASMEAFAAIGFVIGVSVNAADAVIALGFSAVMTGVSAKHLGFRRAPRVAIGLWLTLALLAFLLTLAAGWTYDASWDGNTAHQSATAYLAGGWNPIHEQTVDRSIGQWGALQYFAKGAWTRNAALLLLTGKLEQAKVQNLLLIIAGLAAWLALLLQVDRRRPSMALAGSIAAALNPVSMQQAFTFLVDGQLSSLIVLVVGFSGLVFTSLSGWPIFVALGLSLAVLATVKSTGLVFAVILGAGLVVGTLIFRVDELKRLALAVAASLALVVLLTGFNPYVVSTVRYGSPFYPLVGSEKVDIVWNLQPPNFAGKSSLHRLGLALFSRTADYGERAVIKVPFSIARSEIRPYLGFQTPIGGFGPWFGGILIVALVVACVLLINATTRRDRTVLAAIFAAAVIGFSGAINPEAWWARYSPQLWLVPLVILLAAAYRGADRWLRTLSMLAVVALLVNAAFVASISFANVVHARLEIDAALDEAAAWPNGALVSMGAYDQDFRKFSDRGIRYRLVPATAVPDGKVVPYLTAIMAPDDGRQVSQP